jgi:hypothetical protein
VPTGAAPVNQFQKNKPSPVKLAGRKLPQAIVINGRLEHHQVDTLAGPLPSICIVVHCIDDTLGAHPHQPAIA